MRENQKKEKAYKILIIIKKSIQRYVVQNFSVFFFGKMVFSEKYIFTVKQ